MERSSSGPRRYGEDSMTGHHRWGILDEPEGFLSHSKADEWLHSLVVAIGAFFAQEAGAFGM
ncbi:MAG: hypothetical protein GX492_11800 [Firmicutes bacterium]|nr:hypothetical protein [Bacillota bacterium]